MSRRPYALTALLAVAASLDGSSAKAEQPVWYWFTPWGGPTIDLEVRFDRATICQSKIPLCHVDRGSIKVGGHDRRIHFSFQPHRENKWSGYRDGEDVTKAGISPDGYLWEAGADPEDILVGVTLSDAKGIHVNAIHVALPHKRTETEIAAGLVIITRPEDGVATEPHKPAQSMRLGQGAQFAPILRPRLETALSNSKEIA